MAPIGSALRTVSSEAWRDAIPDSGVFQSPIYQFWAGEIEASDGTSPVDFPEVLGGLSDATAVGGPTYRNNQSGFETAEYDGTEDAHDFTADSQMPTGNSEVSVACLIYIDSFPSSGASNIFWFGTEQGGTENDALDLRLISSGSIEWNIWGDPSPISWSGASAGGWITVGGSYGGSDGGLTIYGNGSSIESGSAGADIVGPDGSIGYRYTSGDRHGDIFVAEVVVSDTEEPAQSFSDYHSDRLG